MSHQTTAVPINKLFKCAEKAPDSNTIAVRTDTHPKVPEIDPNFEPARANFADFKAWLTLASPKEWLFIAGPTGAGKSSLVRHMASKLNIPVWAVTGHQMLDVQDLFTQRVLLGGDTLTQFGPLTQAYTEGGWLVIDEIDQILPSRLVGLNEVGSVITLLDMGGQMVKPHPDFRLIATGNSLGLGDSTGLYAGVARMNAAFMDRFTVMRMGYPDADTEVALLQSAFPSTPEVIHKLMVKVAGLVRNSFAPMDDAGNLIPGEIEKTISTRGLLRWAAMAEYFYVLPASALAKPATHALDRAIAFGAEPSTRAFMHEMVQRVFGDDERNPPVSP